MLLNLLVLGLCLSLGQSTERPIIGILTQELPYIYENYNTTYLTATYVKSVDASGAQVVPILCNQSVSYYEDLLQKINGVLFPGGMADLHGRYGIAEATAIIYNISLKMNEAGDHFPILGICQGLELMAMLDAGTDPLTTCSALSMNLPLNFHPGFEKSSLFGGMEQDTISILSKYPVTVNYHTYCLTAENFTRFGLDEHWKILSTNKDANGLEFISTMERTDYPIAAVQFHPEKNSFEWSPSQDNPHTFEAILSSRGFYDWLVTEARKNNHSFSNYSEESEALIYNYKPTFLGKKCFLGSELYLF